MSRYVFAITVKFLTRNVLPYFAPIYDENMQCLGGTNIADLTSSDVALICSIQPRRSYARARPRTALTGASIHGRLARKKSLCARLLSSLPHYSIMMACGVCRTPSALPFQSLSLSLSLRVYPSFLLSFSLSLSVSFLSSSSSVSSSPSVLSFSFIRRPILVHVPAAFFVWSSDRERERDR